MRSHTLRLAAVTALLLLVAVSQGIGFDFSQLEKAVTMTTLDNGLTVIVMERHDAPVVSLLTYANVGGADDPKEYTGLAHMFEHMAFKGTTNIGSNDLGAELKAMKVEDSLFYELRTERSKGRLGDSTRLAALEAAFDAAIEDARQYVVANAFDHVLESEGGTGINAGTSKDQTMYFVNLPSNKLELWMVLESDRFKNAVLREMYRERNVIAEERRQTLENNPFMRTIASMQAAAFEAHPYSVSVVGHMSDIMNYTRDAAKNQYEKYYVASNLVIGIVGDVKTNDVIKMARKYWGDLPKKPKPERIATIEPEQKGERRVTLEDPSQPLWVAGYHVPEDTHPDWPVVQALSDYLGRGRTSLLYENLVKKNKIAASVGVYPGWPGSKYPCLFMVYAVPAAEHSNQECEEQIFTEIDKLSNELIPAEEVEKIKARAKANFVRGMDNNMGLALQLASFQVKWGDWRQLFKQLDRINAVTPEDLQRVAKEYLTPQNRTVATLNTIGS